MFDQTEQTIVAVATLILAGACLSRDIPVVRIGAVVSGVLFLAVAVVSGTWIIAATGSVLILVNALRLVENWRVQTHVRASREDAIDPSDFEQYFRRERHDRGDTLFLKGNPGSYAYYVAHGEITIPEAAASVGPGEFFGEFSLFTDGRLRTASAVCRTDVELYRIEAETLAEIFRRKPDFAFALVRLIVQRMTRNNDRLGAENAKLRIDRQIAGPRLI